MPSDKRNLIMAIVTGLIFSLFNVALFWNVPFCQLQLLQCLHHGSTKAYLCSTLFCIPFSTCGMWVIAIGMVIHSTLKLRFLFCLFNHAKRWNRNLKLNVHKSSSLAILMHSTVLWIIIPITCSFIHNPIFWFLFYLFKFTIFAPTST